MATRTLTAMFDRYDQAAEAVRQLEAAGIPHGDISIVSNDAEHRQYHDADGDDSTGTGTGTGASLGTILGGGAGLLAGLGMLAIPGLGPVVAAGWLASMLVGAGVGAAAGGVVGALTGAGVSETDAHAYAEGVRRGGTLVTVRTDEAAIDTATRILDHDGTVDLNDRTSTWRSEGWNGSYPDVNTASLGYADTDRAYPGTTGIGTGAGLSGTTGTFSPTTSTMGGLGAGIGGAAATTADTVRDDTRRAGETIREDAHEVADALRGTTPATGPRVGLPGVGTGPDVLPEPALGTAGTRSRVRVYDQR